MTRERPAPSSPEASRRMRANRRTDTKPEKQLRSELHRRGLRFRVDARPADAVNHRIDIIFPGPRVAVEVLGCFWHACPQHGTVPKSNTEYWQRKFERNKERDRQVAEELRADGWDLVVVWEHEDIDRAADRVEAIVKRSQPTAD